MANLIRSLQSLATGKKVLILFVITMVVYLTMIFFSIPAVVSFAPDMALFDLSPMGYSYEHATALLETLGPEGRAKYLTTQLPLDFLYPGLFAITCSLLLTWLFLKSTDAKSKIFCFALVPILAGICDYLENFFIILMINSFPDLSQSTVGIASIFTILKSGLTSVFFLLFFWGLARCIKEKRNRSQIKKEE